MGYQALLFCPDEKTARTVTQVLSELEFNVESCTEPFAAVKKLMGAHFDAIVVDCDNEQNATLLFKSARNTTSNQASLAVAVVEGQAGVAKAFRIGANLVLTKPINIEQAKGTLRVARGLLRKGEPVKPGAAPSPASAASVSAPAPAPVKPASRPVPPLKSNASTPAVAPRPLAPPVAKPIVPVRTAAASSIPAAPENEALPEILAEESDAAPSLAASIAPPAPKKSAPVPQAAKSPVPTAASGLKPAAKPVLPAASTPAISSGAASAPAPAREAEPSHAAEITPAITHPDTAVSSEPAEAVESESPSYVGSAPSFTFGGANVPAESSAGKKKILLGVAAVALVAAAIYFGWPYFQGLAGPLLHRDSSTTPAPVSAPAKKPVSTPPASASTTAPSLAASQPAAETTNPIPNSVEAAPESDSQPAASPSSSPASKTAPAAKPVAPPLVVKGGAVPVIHTKSEVPDAAAPSMTGIAAPGSSTPPPNLVSSGENAPKLALQTVNISQGVSQGLLIKKVQPIYPRTALGMRIEGTVELLATISKTGVITHVKVLSGQPQLAQAAAEAVKQWKYKPYLLNGEPVEIQTQVTINFKLPQ